MKKLIITIIIFNSLFSAFSKEKIAILELQGNNVDISILQGITETLATSIAEYGKYTVIERSQLDTIYDELKLISSEDFEEDTAIEIGALAKAKHVLVGSISKIGNKYAFNIRVTDVETGQVTFATNIAVENQDDLFETTIKIAGAISGVENIDLKVVESDKTETPEETSNEEEKPKETINIKKIAKPKYVYTDTFDSFNTNFWKLDPAGTSMDAKAICKDGKLIVTAPEDKRGAGRKISIISKEFHARESFTFEVSFKDINLSSEYLALTVGTRFWDIDRAMQVACEIDSELYGFYWFKDDEWQYNEDKEIDRLFGNEDQKYHTFKIVYDKDKKVAAGYLDGKLVDYVTDFSFKKGEKFFVKLYIYQYKKNDLKIEFDNFKSSIDFK